MNLNDTIAQLNQQNAEIARIERDLKNQTIETIAYVSGFAVGFAATFVVTLKYLAKK